MAKEKLLFLIFDLGHGGAEKVLVQLVNSLDKEKYDITVQTIFEVGVNKEFLSSHIHRKWLFKRQFHGMKYIIRLFSPRLLHKLLIREHYDCEIAYLEGIPTRVVSGCNDKNTKTFAWVHIEMIDKKKFLNTYLSVNEAKRCYKNINKIAFVSEVALASFLEKTGWTNLNIAVVHNTIDNERILSQSREDISIKPDSSLVNLCSVGRLVNQKGYVRLINILGRILLQGISKWHFYLLGDGELRGRIEQSIEDYNLQQHITLLGYDTNPYKYVSKMDYFVCSSYKEGYSTAVTESVIVGTPVLTTDCSGMKEILGETGGVIVENSDEALEEGLIRLLNNPSLKEKYKKGAIMRSSFFSKDKTLKEFEDFIHN